MKDERWRQAWDLYEAAGNQPAEFRRPFLESQGADSEMIQRVLDMFESFSSDLGSQDPASYEPAGRSGDEIGRYVILEAIGRGGMGEVYSGRDTELDRTVALKFLQPATAALGSFDLFIREAKTLSALNHPNIVTVHEVIHSASTRAIVMELIEGTALRAVCSAPLAARRVVQIGQQVALALAAAHRRGIVHRDIKPENIMVRPDGYVKVLDFGLARQAAAHAGLATGMSYGTLRYMSPEQFAGEAPTAASDIFSLGLVLFELAAGAHPYRADSPFETAHRIANETPQVSPALRQKIGVELASLILAMLNREPQARPSAEEVAGRLAGMLAQDSTGTGKRWRRAAWAAAAAGMVSFVALAAAVWLAKGPARSPANLDISIRPLTSQPGWEVFPALSPDGSSVAYGWASELDHPREIYVKRIDADAPMKVTTSPVGSNVGAIVWSPDGARIAFKRWFGRGGAIYLIDARGGEERKIIDLTNADLSSGIDWSPDGAQLAFTDSGIQKVSFSVNLYNFAAGKVKKLTAPPLQIWGDWDPRFSSDGKTVAFKRVSNYLLDEIYVVDASGGQPRKITHETRGIYGFGWMPDGQSLVLSWQRDSNIFGLWRVPVSGSVNPQRLIQGSVDAVTPAAARHANRIVWVDQFEDSNIYRVATAGGKTPERIVASPVRDRDADYSSDGRMVFISDRSGTTEVWIARSDGSNELRATSFNQQVPAYPRWSPDGRRIAFDARVSGAHSIYVVGCAPDRTRCDEPKRLSPPDARELFTSWSSDGKSVYFASDRTGRFQVWKRPLDGGAAVQVTRQGGFAALESTDGKWLYFTKAVGENTIWRAPGPKASENSNVDGQMLIGPPYHISNDGWTVTSKEIFFLDRAADWRSATIRAYNLETRRVRPVASLGNVRPEREMTNLSVSPDSRWLLFSQLDRSGSNVMVADLR